MGLVSSKLDDRSAPTTLTCPLKFSIASASVCDGSGRCLYRIIPINPKIPDVYADTADVSSSSSTLPSNAASINSKTHANQYISTLRVTAGESTRGNFIEYIQDPSMSPECDTILPLLLKLPNQPDLNIRFRLALHKGSDGSDNSVEGLTLIHASSIPELNAIITKEFQHDPNIQKYDNVNLLGDFSTADLDKNESTLEIDWTWKWKADLPMDEDYNGWRIALGFAQYDKREHKLSLLGRSTFWIDSSVGHNRGFASSNTQTINTPNTPRVPPFRLETPKLEDSYFTPIDPEETVTKSANETPATQNLVSTQLVSPREGILAISPQQTHMNHGLLNSLPKEASAPSLISGLKREDDTYQREDGPLFRATVAALEKKNGIMKGKLKRLLKQSYVLWESQTALNDAMRNFLSNLNDLAQTEGSAFQPTLEHCFDTSFRDVLIYEIENLKNMQSLVIEPLRRLYEVDVKGSDSKKREFEEESREYYSWLSRYLSMKQEAKGKKKLDSDTKYQDKRRTFELKRFDYYNYMKDLHGGRKEQDAAYHLSLFALGQANLIIKASKNISCVKPRLDQMVRETEEATKELALERTEKEERRRRLEKLSMPDPFSTNGALNSSTLPSATFRDWMQSPPRLTRPTDSNQTTLQESESASEGRRSPNQKINGEDMSPVDDVKKEGLLWAMSRPMTTESNSGLPARNLAKQPGGWHKFWVVVAGGKLCEYTNWKQSLDLHYEPINLEMALVREARNAERRFCFEVVTPQYRRVYQATSDDDMMSWIHSIQNAIVSKINSSSPEGDKHKYFQRNQQQQQQQQIPKSQPQLQPQQQQQQLSTMASQQSSSNDFANTIKPSTSSHNIIASAASRHVGSSPISAPNTGIFLSSSGATALEGNVSTSNNNNNTNHHINRQRIFDRANKTSFGARVVSGANATAAASSLSEALNNSSLSPSNNHNNDIGSKVGGHHLQKQQQQHQSEDSYPPPVPAKDKNKPASNVSSNASSNDEQQQRQQHSLMTRLRAVDALNCVCADCGSRNSVEWVSINLMVIVCIECSGIHRSLGSHVSKIRSLMLDTVSFTRDLTDAMLAIGNTASNRIWEAELTEEQFKTIKPTPKSNSEQRRKFVVQKYVDREFIVGARGAGDLSRGSVDPDLALRYAIRTNDCIGAIGALAQGADVENGFIASVSRKVMQQEQGTKDNCTMSSSDNTERHIVLPSLTTAGSGSPSMATHQKRRKLLLMYALLKAEPSGSYPIPEILIQWGARLPAVSWNSNNNQYRHEDEELFRIDYARLSPQAHRFLETKKELLTSRNINEPNDRDQGRLSPSKSTSAAGSGTSPLTHSTSSPPSSSSCDSGRTSSPTPLGTTTKPAGLKSSYTCTHIQTLSRQQQQDLVNTCPTNALNKSINSMLLDGDKT